MTGGLGSLVGGVIGGFLGGLLGGGGGKSKEIEQNTRYTHILLKNMVDELQSFTEGSVWQLIDTVFQAGANTAKVLWVIRSDLFNSNKTTQSKLTQIRDNTADILSALKSASKVSTSFAAASFPTPAGAGPSFAANISITAMDNSDMERAVRQKVAPALEKLWRIRRR